MAKGPKSVLAKFKSRIEKEKSVTLQTGFSKSELWCSSGNYALNYLLSGDYYRGYSFGRSVLIGGISGSGKSVLIATSCVQAQQEHGADIIWVDTEHASDNIPFFEKLGMDLNHFFYVSASTIEDTKKTFADLMDAMIDDLNKAPDVFDTSVIRPIVFVIDSFANLMTESQWKHAEEGDVKGDQGQQAKQLKDLIKGITHMIKRRPILVLGATHSMASTDAYSPDEKLTGGRGLEYLASIAFMFSKLKLKSDAVEDTSLLKTKKSKDKDTVGPLGDDLMIEEYTESEEEETDAADKKKKKAPVKVVGTKCKATTYKNRFGIPNQTVEMQLVYPNGLSKISGLFDLLVGLEKIGKAGNMYTYVDWKEAGIPEKFFKVNFPSVAEQIVAYENRHNIGKVPEIEYNEVDENTPTDDIVV